MYKVPIAWLSMTSGLRLGPHPTRGTGSELEADTPRGRVPVTVAPLPFLDPNKDVPKS
jgi:hypothetical protein